MTRRKQSSRDVRRGDGYITERVLSTGETRYQSRWHDGSRWRARTFRAKDDAEDHLRDIGRKKRRREFIPDEDYTLLDVVDDYLERGKSRWSGATYHSYRTIRTMYFDGTPIGSTLLPDVTPRLMQHWIDRQAKTLSTSRLSVIRAVLSGAFNEAVRLDMIARNPMIGVRMPRRKGRAYTIWTQEQLATVLDAARDDSLMYPYYILAVSTGMRPGEILALTWADIDLDHGVLTCHRTLSRDADGEMVIVDTTKTGGSRTIAIPDIAVMTLVAHRRRQSTRRLAHPSWHDGDLVLDRGNGTFVSPPILRRAHKLIIDPLDVPWCRLHDIRHLAATYLLESGVDIKTVSTMLGHTSAAKTLDMYGHVTERMNRRAADTLGGILDRKHA